MHTAMVPGTAHAGEQTTVTRPVADVSGGRLPGFDLAIAHGTAITVSVHGLAAAPPAASHDRAAAQRRRTAARAATPEPDGVEMEEGTIGAGFFIDGEGHIVTAAHVVEGSQRLLVQTHDQQVLDAELVGLDPDSDIALLKVASTGAAPRLGHSVSMRTGDWVVAIGAPYGLDRTILAGIVGGLNRHFADDANSAFIQTDVGLAPGSSGGPLLDMNGAIVGMNARVLLSGFGAGGLGLSTPIEIVLQVAGELREGAIRRPRLGASFADVSATLARRVGRSHASGAWVQQVAAGSLGRAMGLQAGDIVTSMNGQPIGDGADLARMLLAWREVRGTTLIVFRARGYRQLRSP